MLIHYFAYIATCNKLVNGVIDITFLFPYGPKFVFDKKLRAMNRKHVIKKLSACVLSKAVLSFLFEFALFSFSSLSLANCY